MIRILDTKQIKALDAFTIHHEPVASIALMERACRAFVDWFVRHVDASKKIGIVCGTGNNGGDGLGIARMLNDWGYSVNVWVIRGKAAESPDFKMNFDRLKGKVVIAGIDSAPSKKLLDGLDVVIDAVFGSGLSRPAEGIYAEAIRCMNESTALRIAVDIPSGLLADGPSSGEILKADYTVTFQLPKLAFLLPQSRSFTGEWIAVDIGLHRDFIKKAETKHFMVTIKDARRILKPRSKFDHKGIFGHALLIAGSFGKIGAAVLASRAVLRAGAGLLTAHVPRCGYSILQTTLPEAMVSVDENESIFTGAPDLEKYNAIGIGPGLGRDPLTVKGVEAVLKNYRKPVVIDADGLNILGAHKDLFAAIPENSILTPHPKEFERLAGKSSDDFDRLKKQAALAAQLRSVVIVKGAYTSIAAPDGSIFFNSTGNPGMATGGSGDVLTGILTGLLAQHYPSAECAVLGTFLHGLSGDQAALEKGESSLMASDLINHLPAAFLKVSLK